MKKSTIFTILIGFVLSIFLITYFGLKVRTDQFKEYLNYVSINECEVIEEEEIHYQLKYKEFTFVPDDETKNIYYMSATIKPEKLADEPGRYEYVITSGNGTFEVDGITYNYADVYKNRITFNCPCAVTVTLRTLDGSGLSDSALFICE